MSPEYQIQYLPSAKNDLLQISKYIGQTLQAPQAARQLLQELSNSIYLLRKFPYAHTIFHLHKPLKKETRLLPVTNFAVLYVVHENNKTVEIQAVVYAKRNLEI